MLFQDTQKVRTMSNNRSCFISTVSFLVEMKSELPKAKTNTTELTNLKTKLKEKNLHVQFSFRTQISGVDKVLTYQRLQNSGLKHETQKFILAVQDQNLLTQSCQIPILLNGTNKKCHLII